MENKRLKNFVISHSIETHPLAKAKIKTRIQYYATLEYFVRQCVSDDEYANARLLQYHTILVGNEAMLVLTDENRDDIIGSIVNAWFLIRPWRWKYRYWLMCDIALITADKKAFAKAQEIMVGYLNKRQSATLGLLVATLFADDEIPQRLRFAEDLIHQFRINCKFAAQPEMRILVTANVSAGKSTLINALVGRPVTKTAEEAYTANLSYIFNKPFEDNSVHLFTSTLNLKATYGHLMSVEKEKVSYISSFFRGLLGSRRPICLIDTPGVNSSINRAHGHLTRKALVDENYDKLIYVLNATKIGTDEEFQYLKYILKNVPKDKIVFVLNKLDTFKKGEDSIAESIEGIRSDLIGLGYENPAIYPISAYFALLVKRKQNGEILTEEEEDMLGFYIKKFGCEEYDLSRCFTGDIVQNHKDELTEFHFKSGIYSLEYALFGGEKDEKGIY